MGFPLAQSISLPTPALLSALATLGAGPGGLSQGFSDGQTALCISNGLFYVLQTSSAVVDGITVLATRDDSTRRWIIVDSSITGVAAVASAGATVVVANPTGPTVNLEVNQADAAPPDIAGTGAVGTSIQSAREDHTHKGVSSLVAGTDIAVDAAVGAVTVTGNSIARAATPAALAALATTGVYATGAFAFVTAMRTGGGPGVYVLQAAVSSVPDSFFVVATADDAARQWVYSAIVGQGLIGIYYPEIDLTVSPQTIQLLPPLTGYLVTFIIVPGWLLSQRDGTVTVGPTASCGTDASATDVNASTVNAPLATATVNNTSAVAGGLTAIQNLPLTSNGLVLKITNPATLGTATVFKARLRTQLLISKF